MHRRSSLKILTSLSSGLILLPTWTNRWDDTITSSSSIFNGKERKILSALVETYLPKTTAVGGLDVGVDRFIEKIFSECYTKDVQGQLHLYLKSLNTLSKSTYQNKFVDLAPLQRKNILLVLKTKPEEETKTMQLFKSEIIRGFNTSEIVMTQYHGYEVAPGHFNGCVEAINN